MRIAITTSAVLAVTIVGAAAADVGGNYRVSGKNFDGSNYSGRAEITVTSKTTCRINWYIGSSVWRGICMRNGDAFAASYRLGDAVGLVIYRMNSDGSLEGLWTIADKAGVGSETLTPR